MKLLQNVKRRRQLKELAKLPDGKTWETAKYKGWGLSLSYHSRTDEGHKWVGWLPVPPKPGDLIEHPTSSGMARFKVLEVERVRDPDDMFWALTPHEGYLVQDVQ